MLPPRAAGDGRRTARCAPCWPGSIDIVTVTSVESLRNLHAMLDAAARERLRRTPIVVVGPRQAAAASALGILTEPQVAQAASDAAILDAIKAWRASQKPL